LCGKYLIGPYKYGFDILFKPTAEIRVNSKKAAMNTAFQKGQKVLTPEGEGLIEEIIGEDIIVKLNSGDEKSFSEDQIEDDSDQG
jgi:hypothetical protein